ncbi:DUF5681 domain-containing protein [Sedimentimonas flavescens]|uniref:DUF5681 domain-containing protein n=1 Tax=Sedimentimonas flavescens TaxID=2851012 RepID=UPI0021A803C1|nr:DUF5681 domain-containing protein [Sedimentimonas flavescens]MCT2541262.1 DUF5681 domain-containing protein [Sedimentimonas flavescens]
MTRKRGGKGTFAGKSGYEVGYGKPPEKSRFQKGQSGNPRGRPKGSKNKVPGPHEERMKAIILLEAYRSIKLRDGTRNVSVPMVQAVMRSVTVNAVKGQHRAQRLFAELLASVEASRKLHSDETFKSALDYKITWERELNRRARLGITDLPEPVPHPDHIMLDMDAGEVRVLGPLTQAEKDVLENLRRRKDALDAELVAIAEMLETESEQGMRDMLERDAERTRTLLRAIERGLAAIPKPGSTRLLGPTE